MTSKQRAKKRKTATRSLGYPVCVVLKDGSYYIGRVIGLEKDQLILAGNKGKGKMKSSNLQMDKAQISGLLGSMLGGGGLGSMLGGFGPGASAGGSGGGFASMLGGVGLGSMLGGLGTGASAGGQGLFGNSPVFGLGLGMLRFIMPLMGAFRI